MSRAAASSDAFHAVSDPTRRAILDRLRAGSAPVTEIASGFRMSRPAVSKHLKVLREARLVTEKRDGRQRVYELTPGPLLECVHWLEGYRKFWQVSLAGLKQYLETEK
jgi:DNA-binding transcriptional ArsR family regulator